MDTSVKPKLIYDFTNWAPHFYTQTWDHQGSPELAEQVIHLLNKVCYEKRSESADVTQSDSTK